MQKAATKKKAAPKKKTATKKVRCIDVHMCMIHVHLYCSIAHALGPVLLSSTIFLPHPTEGRPQEEEDRRQEEISTQFIYYTSTAEMVEALVMYAPL